MSDPKPQTLRAGTHTRGAPTGPSSDRPRKKDISLRRVLETTTSERETPPRTPACSRERGTCASEIETKRATSRRVASRGETRRDET